MKQPQVTRTPEEWDAYWAAIVVIEPVAAVKKGKQAAPARLGGKAMEKLRGALEYGRERQPNDGMSTRLFNVAMPAKMRALMEQPDGDVLFCNRVRMANRQGFHETFPAYVEAVLADPERRVQPTHPWRCDFADAGIVAEQAILMAAGLEEVARILDGALVDAYKQLGETPIADWLVYSMFVKWERLRDAIAAEPNAGILSIPDDKTETDVDRYLDMLTATQLGANRNIDLDVKALVAMSVIFRQCGATILRHLAQHRAA